MTEEIKKETLILLTEIMEGLHKELSKFHFVVAKHEKDSPKCEFCEIENKIKHVQHKLKGIDNSELNENDFQSLVSSLKPNLKAQETMKKANKKFGNLDFFSKESIVKRE